MARGSSRERMMAALRCQQPDHTPCSFMMYNALKSTSKDYAEFIEKQLEMGLDAAVDIPPRPPVLKNDWYNLRGLDVNFHPDVHITEWVETRSGERWPLMVKEYHTPAGTLRAEVNQDDEWRWSNHVPLFDDFLETRSRKFIVQKPEDLAALRYLLVEPDEDVKAAFWANSRPAIEQARQHDLLVTGGWGVGADLLGWIYGLENMIYTAHDQPDFLQEMLNIVSEWNRARMSLLLDAKIDLLVRRAWYENCDFFSPRLFRKFLLPILAEETAQAHQAGALFGYILTDKGMPLLDMIIEAGVDVLIGIDPAAFNLEETKRRVNGKMALWGGVNGHRTLELGEEESVRAEVRAAMQTLAPSGGFILSPVDNVRENTPTSRRNAAVLVDEWKKYW